MYVSFDGIQVGELQGKYLTQNVPKGNYILLSGDPKDPTSKLYKDGAMEYITPLVTVGSIKILIDKAIPNWDSKIAYYVVKEALKSNKNINAILAPTDDIAGGAIKALEEKGIAGTVAVTGQDAEVDAIKRIRDGTQSMTVLKDTRELAKAAIDSAIKLVNGQFISTNAIVNNGKEDIPSIIFTPVVINRYNIIDNIINTGFIKASEFF